MLNKQLVVVCVFGYIKHKLQETDFMEKGNLFVEIRDFLNGILGKVLRTAFIEWANRL
jgi:hypothetical protein